MANDRWFDVEDLEIADASDVTFDLSLGAYDFLVEEMVRTGAWWVRPFARDASRNLYGVRLGPQAVVSEAPVVLIPEGSSEARTVASRAAFFVPTHVWRWLPHEWDAARALEDGGWAQLVKLHRALGGAGGLGDLRGLVRDEGLRDLLAISSLGKLSTDDRTRRIEDITARLDRGPGTPAFFAYLAALASEDGTMNAPVPWPDMGPWTASVASLAFRVNQERPEAALRAAWEVMNQPPGLDSGRGEHPPFELAHGGGPRLAIAAARALVQGVEPGGPWRADALWPAVAALAEGGDLYDGARHLEAADALERRGEPARAFVALTAAAYFSFHATGASSPEALDAAIELTRRDGPETLLEHLETVESCRAAAELTDLRRSVVSSIAAMMQQGSNGKSHDVAVVEAEAPAVIAPPRKKTGAAKKKVAAPKKKQAPARKKVAAKEKTKVGATKKKKTPARRSAR